MPPLDIDHPITRWLFGVAGDVARAGRDAVLDNVQGTAKKIAKEFDDSLSRARENMRAKEEGRPPPPDVDPR